MCLVKYSGNFLLYVLKIKLVFILLSEFEDQILYRNGIHPLISHTVYHVRGGRIFLVTLRWKAIAQDDTSATDIKSTLYY
jgi:hypothetical protein